MNKRFSRGQSLVEFAVCLAAMLPLFMGVYYVGRYADIQQTTVQASRYAAFERVVRPSTASLSNADLEDKVRARFFLRGDFGPNQGEIRSNDSVASVAATDGHNPLWRDNRYGQLLKDHKQVSLTFQQANHNSALLNAAALPFNVNTQQIQIANVEVALVDKLSDNATPPALKIGATTAALGGAMNAAGSAGVQSAIGRPTATFDSALPGFLGGAMSALIAIFEGNAPQFSCHRVEFVPRDRLSGNGGGGGGC